MGNLGWDNVQKVPKSHRLFYSPSPKDIDPADFYSSLIYRVLTEAELQKRHEEAHERHAARLAGTQEDEQAVKEGKVPGILIQ